MMKKTWLSSPNLCWQTEEMRRLWKTTCFNAGSAATWRIMVFV
jgi:hypothetical protein